MRFFTLFCFLIFFAILNAVPVLTSVQVECLPQTLQVTFAVEDFTETCQFELAIFQKDSLAILNLADSLLHWQSATNNEQQSITVTIERCHLPQDFSLESYAVFPKLIVDGRIYYEMEKFDQYEYSAQISECEIEALHCAAFWISKYELTNEQYWNFVQHDGYDLEKFWLIPETIMAKADVGWFYQGKLQILLPGDWDRNLQPPYQNAFAPFQYGPVTHITWFEANAITRWMQGRLPFWPEMKAVWDGSLSQTTNGQNAVSAPEKAQLNGIRGSVGEWLNSGFTPIQSLCRGCNEMFILANSVSSPATYPTIIEKCPLYKNPTIGARLVIPIEGE